MSTPTAQTRRRILAFDDEEDIRAFLGDAFAAIGYDARLFESGEAAITFLDSADGAGWPDVVMMDISIGGEDPLETFAALRERLPDVPVVVSSGYRCDEVAEQLEAMGAACFLGKPYRLRTLRATVDEVVAGT